MIYFVGPGNGDDFVKVYKFLYRIAPKYVTIYPRVDRLTFEEILGNPGNRYFPGTYIFRNFNRLSQFQLYSIIKIIENLRKKGTGYRILNDPRRVRDRFELLRLLHRLGINEHNAYRVTEFPRPERWPVMLRSEIGHWKSQLLFNQPELDRATDELMKSGILRSDALVVEFSDTRTKDGLYVQYGALRIGERIVPQFRSVSEQWDVTRFNYEFMYGSKEYTDAEVQYVIENPHAKEIMELFEIANMEYGRIDYALKDGKIQVWEINSNPEWIRLSHIRDKRLEPFHKHFTRTFAEALYAIDTIDLQSTPGLGSDG